MIERSIPPMRGRAEVVTRESAPMLKHHAQARGVHPSQISAELSGDRTGLLERYYAYVYQATERGKVNVAQLLSEAWAVHRQAQLRRPLDERLEIFDRDVRTEHDLEAQENAALHLALTGRASLADYMLAVRREWGAISSILAQGEIFQIEGVDPFRRIS